MIRQICPHCFQPVDLPDSAAGSAALCPKCNEAFPVPGTYSPAVTAAAGAAPASVSDRPPPPPGLAPEALPGYTIGPTPRPEPAAEPGDYEKAVGFTLGPRVLGWVPAIALTLILILTFFTWVGTYAGGYTIYSQNAWLALLGQISVNLSVPDEILADETDLKKRVSSNLWLLPYLLILVLTVALAWGERVLLGMLRPRLSPQVTARVDDIWPWRFAILAGFATLLLLLLGIQMWRGFGLETAIQQRADERFAEQTAQAEASKASKQQRLAEIQKGQEINRTGLDTTMALDLVLLGHIVTVAVLFALAWLDRRGSKPPPRVVLQY